MRRVHLLLLALPASVLAQTPAPDSRLSAQPPAAALRESAAVRSEAGAGAPSVAWVYEERFRLVHACVFTPKDGGRIECWSKPLSESKAAQ